MRALLLLGFCLLAAACADLDMKQGSKSMARRDIAPGPGLLTGPTGEFVIFRVEGSPTEEAPASPPSAPAKEGEPAQ